MNSDPSVRGSPTPRVFGGQRSGHVSRMRAEVVVQGMLPQADLWPYAIDSERHGASTLLTLEIHDRQEFLTVLETLVTRGIDVSQAQVLS